MNFLAHFFLADVVGGSMTGQLLGDFVKGTALDGCDDDIREAIMLHRKIDSFSDAHPVTLDSRNRIGPIRRRFAGVIVDLCYDHFLALHWHRFSSVPLSVFAAQVYTELAANRKLLPEKARPVVSRMSNMDWLSSYVALDNVSLALDRIAGRLTRGRQFEGAAEEIALHYTALQCDFFSFFPDLITFTRSYVANPDYERT